jgi:hypothetical protein
MIRFIHLIFEFLIAFLMIDYQAAFWILENQKIFPEPKFHIFSTKILAIIKYLPFPKNVVNLGFQGHKS